MTAKAKNEKVIFTFSGHTEYATIISFNPSDKFSAGEKKKIVNYIKKPLQKYQGIPTEFKNGDLFVGISISRDPKDEGRVLCVYRK